MTEPPIVFPKWKGAWPEDVFFLFAMLTNDYSIAATEAGQFFDNPGAVPLDALANPAAARAKRIDHHLLKLRSHDGYSRLKAFAGFKALNAARERSGINNALFAAPFGEMRLLHIVAMLVGNFDPAFIHKRATLADQRKVLHAARVLNGLLMPGAQLAYNDGSNLRQGLASLIRQLDATVRESEATSTRPHRADKDAAQRYWLITFCRMLFDSFGEAPAAIVAEVAAMLGYSPNAATIERYIEAGRTEHVARKTDNSKIKGLSG